MRSVKLPSGAELKVNPAPFADSKNLYQVIVREVGSVEIKSKDELANMMKSMACKVAGSKDIEAALQPCLVRCLYNGKKVTDEIFENVEARVDYIDVCFEVMLENVGPFMKSLYALLNQALAKMGDDSLA